MQIGFWVLLGAISIIGFLFAILGSITWPAWTDPIGNFMNRQGLYFAIPGLILFLVSSAIIIYILVRDLNKPMIDPVSVGSEFQHVNTKIDNLYAQQGGYNVILQRITDLESSVGFQNKTDGRVFDTLRDHTSQLRKIQENNVGGVKLEPIRTPPPMGQVYIPTTQVTPPRQMIQRYDPDIPAPMSGAPDLSPPQEAMVPPTPGNAGPVDVRPNGPPAYLLGPTPPAGSNSIDTTEQ